MNLLGKVAHVTGGGAGIGRATARRFAASGANVAVSDVDEPGGRATVRSIEEAGGTAVFVRADVADEDEVRQMIAFTEEAFGGLDVLVNNAGGAPEPHFPDADSGHWLSSVGVNLLGVMLGTHYGIPALKRRGGGAIVNVSSRAGFGFRSYAAPEYAAAKAAVWRLTAALGDLGERDGIRINCVSPDWVGIESIRDARRELGEEAWAKVGPAELVPPGLIADVVLLLASDEALSGRVVVCPHDGAWGVVPIDDWPRSDPLPGLPSWPPT